MTDPGDMAAIFAKAGVTPPTPKAEPQFVLPARFFLHAAAKSLCCRVEASGGVADTLSRKVGYPPANIEPGNRPPAVPGFSFLPADRRSERVRPDFAAKRSDSDPKERPPRDTQPGDVGVTKRGDSKPTPVTGHERKPSVGAPTAARGDFHCIPWLRLLPSSARRSIRVGLLVHPFTIPAISCPWTLSRS